jgi:hypothetical protein
VSRYVKRVKLVGLAAVLIGCGSSSSTTLPRSFAVGGCDGLETDVEPEPGTHVAEGSSIQWATNPPATGAHYPVWAQLDRSYTSLARGYWMHDAEHGSVVLLYNCPAGCPDIVSALEDTVRAMPIDHGCTLPIRQRAIVAADPLLPADVTVAAVAWNVNYTATCVDPYLTTFITDHYNHGPEDICVDGIDLGGTLIAP